MGNFKAIFFTILAVILGCTKNNEIVNDCIDVKLEEFNMVKYEEQEIGCEFFLELYIFRNKQYFQLGSHCADIVFNPTDCDGNNICGNKGRLNCSSRRYYKKRVRIGIVGISE